MGLTKQQKKDYQREYMRRRRSNKGLTERPGIPVGLTEEEHMTVYPDILDKLTNPVWRDRLSKLQVAFDASHHPDYASACWLGDCNLSLAFDLLECTA